jgi:hypothetical protein
MIKRLSRHKIGDSFSRRGRNERRELREVNMSEVLHMQV